MFRTAITKLVVFTMPMAAKIKEPSLGNYPHSTVLYFHMLGWVRQRKACGILTHYLQPWGGIQRFGDSDS